jgi:UDP-N-acetylmuramoyl-tripeptide--D-alanyl-D-alanine ligase
MIAVTLNELASVVDAQLIGDGELTISTVSTDTRAIREDCLFIALVGDRFDAHDFVENAIDSGAQAVLVEHPIDVVVPQLVVKSTKIALGSLSSWVHQQCETPTVAITGSCGKTTVKEMVASILSLKGQVLFTQGNFNNDIGVPLTLLRSQISDDFAVIELGANHIGEIAYTTQLVKPDIALVNNVESAHIEGFGSLEGVKQAKGEIYTGLKDGALALVNLDSWGEAMWEDVLISKRVKTLSMQNSSANFFADDIKIDCQSIASFTLYTPYGQTEVVLSIIGKHNVANAVAAAAITLEMGATLEEVRLGLMSLTKVKGRVEITPLNNRIKLIDDSYNASVPAMKAAVDLLATFQGVRWLILGNMAELGNESLALHRQVGEHAAPYQFDYVLTYGDDASVISERCQGKHFTTHQDMMAYIVQQLDNNNHHDHVLLVKGANSAGMSKIAAALKEKFL